MRKILTLVLCLALLFVLTLTCFAVTDTLTLTDATAQPGDTVYLTVTFHESVKGTTLGVSYSYDDAVLKPVPSSCTWSRKGSLQDFSTQNTGVWTTASATDLKGSVCILTFKVDEKAKFDQTEVSCQVIVKNGSSEVGTYSATAKVVNQCAHQYGDWQNAGDIGHSRTCSACGGKQTQSHSWDEGTLSEKTDDPYMNVKTYTCTVCGGTKAVDVPADKKPTTPTTEATRPPQKETTAPTLPTKPTYRETYPTKPTTLPTGPTMPLPTAPAATLPTVPVTEETVRHESTQPTVHKDYNSGEIVVDEHGNLIIENHEHSNELFGDADVEGLPMTVPVGTGESSTDNADHVHEHDHDEDMNSTPAVSPGTVIAVISVIVVAVVAGVWYLKKKH